MLQADDLAVFPVDAWIQDGVRWVALNLRPIFLAMKWPVESLLNFNDTILHAIPFPIAVIGTFLLAYRLAGLNIAGFSAVSLIVIAAMGAILSMVADLDRPQEGLLTVSQQAMIDLRATMNDLP